LEYSLCRRCIEEQIAPEFCWITSTDGCEGYSFPKRGPTRIVLEQPYSGSPARSLANNVIHAMEFILTEKKRSPEDIVVFMEDDEYYHPLYLKAMVEMSLFGNTQIFGFNSWRMFHTDHNLIFSRTEGEQAGLCRTGFQASDFMLNTFKQISNRCGAQDRCQIDLAVWHSNGFTKSVTQQGLSLHLAFKGSRTGAAGLGMFHRRSSHNFSEALTQQDPDHTYLKFLLGPAYSRYTKAGIVTSPEVLV